MVFSRNKKSWGGNKNFSYSNKKILSRYTNFFRKNKNFFIFIVFKLGNDAHFDHLSDNERILSDFLKILSDSSLKLSDNYTRLSDCEQRLGPPLVFGGIFTRVGGILRVFGGITTQIGGMPLVFGGINTQIGGIHPPCAPSTPISKKQPLQIPLCSDCCVSFILF